MRTLTAIVTVCALASVTSAAWNPPIGIPAPSFGIDEVHTMYSGQTYDFGAGPVTYPDAGNGPYTHYIDNTHISATDSSNTYGTPSMPRLTVPWNLPAGSVVEIHGTNYGTPSPYVRYWTWFSAAGTAAKPVFIRGADPSNKPEFVGMQLRVGGSYLIIENLAFNNTTIAPKFVTADPDGLYHHISIRGCESYGMPPAAGGTAIAASRGHDIVIYNNHIHDNGDPDFWDENDIHGCHSAAGSKRVWIVDNHIHDVGGDSIQIASNTSDPSRYADLIYIGRNEMHSNGENAVDLKKCKNVIVSQNKMYDFDPSDFATSGSDGTAMVIHDDPIDVWVIFNEIYDSTNGIRCNGSVRAFIIGNKIYNIHHDPDVVNYNPSDMWSGGNGVITWRTPELHVVNNTMYDVDAGISSPGGGSQSHHFQNNLIANLAQPSHHIGTITSSVAAGSTMSYNLMHRASGSAMIKWASSSPVYNIPGFQAAYTGQGLGCVDGDPKFVDAANKDFHLVNGSSPSPAIDAGQVNPAYSLFNTLYGLSIDVDYDGNPRQIGSAPDIGAFEYVPPVVTGRYVFYNNSAWDGNDPAANASDDPAIATNKFALTPAATADFTNYTSYSKGINGIMIDATGTGGAASASDFAFKVGNDSTPSGWTAGPAPASVAIRPGAGVSSSDRITITFADGAIVGKWLEVTYISAGDVFYFGNAPGETGNSVTDAEVTPTDEIYVRNNPATLAVSSASISHAGDFNRDKKVGPTDQVIGRNNGTNSSTALQLITVP